MKKILSILFILIVFIHSTKAQLQNLIVEKYYVSDSLDATDSTNYIADPTYPTPFLPVGSTTYRVFVQIDPGYRIKKIYGTACNPMKIMTTTTFYNNIDRPTTAYFGYKIVKSWFAGGNPTMALDSWLTLGLSSTLYNGLLKTDDPNGSMVGSPSPWLGTNATAGGLLQNNATAAGIPITVADGMVPKTGTFGTWIDDGFRNSVSGGIDTTVLGTTNVGSTLYSSTAYLQQNNGVKGDSATGSKVLVAQLTTTGEISFQFNLELLDSLGNSYNFAPESPCGPLTGDTAVSGILKYPAVCGCQDPNFLEYSANYSCSNPDSCHTRIVYGCTDTLACNYDPHANFNIQYLCCYPGLCADRDVDLVCPSIAGAGELQVFPNPASDQITLQFSSGTNNQTKYVIYDSYGIVVLEKDFGQSSGTISEQIDISGLQTGLYLVRAFIGNSSESKTFMKH